MRVGTQRRCRHASTTWAFPSLVPQQGRGRSALLIFSSREIFLFLSPPGPPGEGMGLIVAVWWGLPLRERALTAGDLL